MADLSKGDKVAGAVFLVESANFKQTRNQKYFIQMSLRDSSGAIKAIRWEATRELYDSFSEDDFLRVDGRVEEFQHQLQLIVDDLERVELARVDFTKFLPVSDRDPDDLERELRQAIDEIQSSKVRELLLSVIDDPEIRRALRTCPAGKTLHHAYVGGLLEHICALLGLTRAVARQYPQLDRDILYAGAILHDIGKLTELSYAGNFQYTDHGQLLGHIALGLEIVREKARGVRDFPEDVLLHVQHIIASHHGVPEYGTLKLPMTAEAIVVHYLDNLDAKLSSLQAIEKELPREGSRAPSGQWSDFKSYLNRRIFFPRKR